MTLTDKDKAALRAALATFRTAEADLVTAKGRAASAAEVEARLRARIGEIAAGFTQPFVAPDRGRVARLLSGETPALLDAKEVESREARNRSLAAERAQLTADADAVAAERATYDAAVKAAQEAVVTARQALVRHYAAVVAPAFSAAIFAFGDEWLRVLVPALDAVRLETKVADNALEWSIESLRGAKIWSPERRDFMPLGLGKSFNPPAPFATIVGLIEGMA